MERDTHITNCECCVMKVIWARDEEPGLREVMAEVNERFNKEWKIQTVSTFLTRLVKKGYLTMERRGRVFYYFPAISESEYAKRETAKCVDFWGNGKVSQILMAYMEEHELTAEDKEEILELLMNE